MSKIHIADISCMAQFKILPSNYVQITGMFIGKFKIASYCLDRLGSKSDKYIVKCHLSTITQENNKFDTEKECKDECIRLANEFINQLKQ